MDFHLQHDLPGYELDAEWHALLATQARTLEAILARIADTVATVSTDPEPKQVRRLHAILEKTEQLLTTLARQNIGIEQGHALFQAMDGGAWPLSLDTASRVYLIAQLNTVFHANLTAARRYLEETRQRLAHRTTEEPHP